MNCKTLLSSLAIVAAMASTILFQSCRSNMPDMITLDGEAQGTYYRIIYVDPQHHNLQSSIDSLLHVFDMTASLWEQKSLIRKVNDNRDSVVNEWFADMTEKSVEMNLFTNGCFDCTIGKIVRAWGFGFAHREDIEMSAIDSMMQYCGKQPTIERAPDGRLIIHKAHGETEIDFNAIAQGYATDIICQFLESHDITNYLVDIGGEVYARGCKPDGTPWKVGVERPATDKESIPEIETTIALQNQSIVTSGNYRKYYEKDGIRYSHTIDPSTGHPVDHTLLSVSVIDTAAWRADALATAFMVMGLEKSLEFIKAHPDDSGMQAVFFIYNEGGKYMTYATPGFKELINE